MADHPSPLPREMAGGLAAGGRGLLSVIAGGLVLVREPAAGRSCGPYQGTAFQLM